MVGGRIGSDGDDALDEEERPSSEVRLD